MSAAPRATGSRREALASLFSASSVAVVGASPKEENLGRRVVESVQSLAPECRIAAIGPSAGGLSGVEGAVSLRELDHVPEAVVIAVGTERVADVVRDACEVG